MSNSNLQRTEMLTYNVHDRGRKFRGVDRHFDTKALAKIINSPDTQERVKHGDMLGYYGHWPRIKFGMAMQETGVIDGKVVALPMAVRTVHLSADDDGNITHQAEFLDTVPGQIAARLYSSKAGGFSSAIDAIPRSMPAIASIFHGFDYVAEPNYSTNRGYDVVLDSVLNGTTQATPELVAMLDQVHAESELAAAHLVSMFDSLQAQHALALEALQHASEENDLLVGMMASGKAGILDSVDGGERIAPHRGDTPDYERFRNMHLVPLAEPVLDSAEQAKKQQENRLLGRLGFRLRG